MPATDDRFVETHIPFDADGLVSFLGKMLGFALLGLAAILYGIFSFTTYSILFSTAGYVTFFLFG